MEKHQKNLIDPKLQALVLNLIEVSKIDTVYRDLYLQRARNLLSEVLSHETYRQLLEDRGLELYLNQKIRSAMNKGDWGEVKQFSERMSILQSKLKRNLSFFEIGKEIYDNYDIVPDVFSPGLQNLTEVSPKDLASLRDKIIKKLEKLGDSDSSWKKFYFQRNKAFEAITLVAPKNDKLGVGSMTEDQLHDEALRALNSGDMEILEQVADSIVEQMSKGKVARQAEPPGMTAESEKSDRLFVFSEETLESAEKLGLVAAKVNAEREYAQICQRYAWHPFVGEAIETHSGATHVSGIPLKKDIPEPLKKRIELYALHPFINSCGARHLPDLVTENFLVEKFPDPEEGVEPPVTELLASLGLKKRRGLSRKQIEKVLFENGPRIIKDELGLELEGFRLVCIPSDLHLRFGRENGWGQQRVWTHFDGYKILKDGKLRALAGGDVRFGGIYDLVTIGREYESDHVMVRFAVVQRKRMLAW